ncbi:hypothetical protein NU09_0360 [Flavobacterium beibuense]|uniref:Uncharacterized protein n=1 Tax=Flavobacterium beibuense TaxID=657326 RepID=A0A444WIS4_9FLAO|nr:hypothetical protein NU09_0360 [Flavobacterium beibuense]
MAAKPFRGFPYQKGVNVLQLFVFKLFNSERKSTTIFLISNSIQYFFSCNDIIFLATHYTVISIFVD